MSVAFGTIKVLRRVQLDRILYFNIPCSSLFLASRICYVGVGCRKRLNIIKKIIKIFLNKLL